MAGRSQRRPKVLFWTGAVILRLFESFAFFGVSGCLIEPTAVHTSFHRHIHTTPQLFLCPTHYPFPTTLPSSALNTKFFSFHHSLDIPNGFRWWLVTVFPFANDRYRFHFFRLSLCQFSHPCCCSRALLGA